MGRELPGVRPMRLIPRRPGRVVVGQAITAQWINEVADLLWLVAISTLAIVALVLVLGAIVVLR